MNRWGRYEGDFVFRWENDGRLMTQQNQLTFIDRNNRRWVVPPGSPTDGASVPWFARALVCPFVGKHRFAAVIHDRYCVTKQRDCEETHRMFLEGMKCSGCNSIVAFVIYAAVRSFGPRW